MITINNCKICNANQDNFLYLFTGRDRFHEIKGEFSIQKCKLCGSVFLNPQPSPDEVRKYYPEDYYSYHLTEKGSFLNNAIAKIGSIFYKRGFDVRTGTRILDIGCGNGEKVSKWLSYGADCYGIEIDRQAVNIATVKGIKAYYGDLLEQDFKDSFFDIIILDNVFEHLGNPDTFLKTLYKLLKNGGKIIISIPNYSSFTRMLFGRYYIGYDVPRHMFLYSPKSIKKLANLRSFSVEKIRYVQNSYQFIASVRIFLRSVCKYFELPSKPSMVFDNQIINLLAFLILFPLNLLRLGDTIKIFLIKSV